MKIKKITGIIVSITIILLIFSNQFVNKVFANTSCETLTNNIKYFNATLYNYNARNLNALARGYTLNDFNQLSIEQRINIDTEHTLFRRPWI